MGAKQSHSESGENRFNNKEWDLLGKIGNTGLLCNRYNPNIKIEEHTISIIDEKQFEKAKELYELRKNDPEFVATKFSKIEKQQKMCSKSYHGQLYTERIPVRLSNITHIPFPDVLHVYNQAFNGYQRLVRSVGLFRIDQQCIGVNNEHIVKVWHSSNFEQISPLHRLDSEVTMVRNIVSIIQGNTDQGTMPRSEPVFSKFLYRESNHVGFGQAKRKLEQYANYFNRGIVPNTLNCVAKFGGAEQIKGKYIDTGTSEGYFKEVHRRNSYIHEISSNHMKSMEYQDKGSDYRPSSGSHYGSSLYTPQKRMITLPNNNMHESNRIFTGHTVTANYNPATYVPLPKPQERLTSQQFNTPVKTDNLSNYKQTVLRQPSRMLTPQHTTNQDYSSSFLSPPPHSTHSTNYNHNSHNAHKNHNINHLQITNRPVIQSAKLVGHNSQYKPLNNVQQFVSDKHLPKAYLDTNVPQRKTNQTDHIRNKSQFDPHNQNIKTTNPPQQIPSNIESFLINSRKTEPNKNVITFNYKPTTYSQGSPPPQKSTNEQNYSARKGSVQLNYNEIKDFPKTLISDQKFQSKLINFDKTEKYQKFSPQEVSKKADLPKQKMSASYVAHQIQNQTNAQPPKFKFDQLFLAYNDEYKKNFGNKATQPSDNIRPKSQVQENCQKNKMIEPKTNLLQRTSLVDGHILQKVQPVKIVHKKIIEAIKGAQVIQATQKKPEKNINLKQIVPLRQKILSAKKVAITEGPIEKKTANALVQSKENEDKQKQLIVPPLQISGQLNPRRSDVFSQQNSEISWGKFDINMKKQKERDTARSGTPLFGSTDSKPPQIISLRSPQLSFNQADQIAPNTQKTFPRHTFESSNTLNNQFQSFPRNTFETANFTVSNPSNKVQYNDENSSIYRPTATYNRFSDEIDDESEAPKFGAESQYLNEYAIVPNTGYDYGVSKNYTLLHAQNNFQVSQGASSPQDDEFFQKNFDKKCFGIQENYEAPIPPPVYENHNFFDLRHNRKIENQAQQQGGFERKSSKNNLENIPRDIIGSKNKLASPDEEFLYQYKAPDSLFEFGGRPSYRPSFQPQQFENYRSNAAPDAQEEQIQPIDKYRASINAYNCYQDNNFFTVDKNETDFVPKYQYHCDTQPKSDDLGNSEDRRVSRAFKDIIIEDGYSSYNMGAYEYGTHIGLNPPHATTKDQRLQMQMNGEQINNIPHVADDYNLEWGSDILAGLLQQNTKPLK